jgi:hypothetical protein
MAVNSVDSVFLAGDDALANQWEILIPPFPGAVDLNNTLIRTTEVTFPGYAIDTYAIDYKTQTFTKPKAKNKTVNEFDFTIRIDKYWKVYEGLENWMSLILNQDTGAMSPDVVNGQSSLIRIPIDVIPVDSNGVVTKKGWTFTGCWISALDGATFNQTGEPLTAKVSIQFIKKLVRI